MSNRIIKSISFNKEDPYEMELFNFAMKQDKYFGKYIKRLIDRDERVKGRTPSDVVPSLPTAVKRVTCQDGDAASDFL